MKRIETSYTTAPRLWLLDIEFRIVRLIELVEFLQPLLAGFLWSEAPVLAMIIPVVGVQLLGALEILLSFFVVALFMEIDGQLETGIRLHLGGRARLDAAREFLVGQR